jgi:beta-aspartyl-peptidase (threonine type)
MKEKGLFALSESKYPDDKKYGTVGAVALDQHGNLAAATSTGGVTNKKYGRVGDSSIIGAGTYAENGNVAVSTTGMGEFFIRKMVAGDVAARMRYLKEDVHTASETIIQGELKEMGGEGGLIAVDAIGDIHFAMNSSGMYRASIDVNGHIEVKIYADE